MTKVPNFITHYYLPDRQPFLSLSDLTENEEASVFEELRHRHKRDPSYRRRYGLDYLRQRQAIEDKLRHLFMARGGEPLRKHPFYFVLGESRWFENLNSNHLALQIDIASLNTATTSFTFPDSYIAMSRCDKPYHNQVFLLHELERVVDSYGLPSDHLPPNYHNYWKGDFEKYIEVQVWEDQTVQPFIDTYLSAKGN